MKISLIREVKFKASDCGNSFQIDYYDGKYQYFYNAGKYYAQRITPMIKGVVEISRDSYLQACQYLKQNISLCGSSFVVWNADGINGTNYWFDGIYFYKQTFGSLVISVPVKILKTEFINICANRF